jgi:hypothetical protein
MVAHISTPEKEQAISELFVILAVLSTASVRAWVFHIFNEEAGYS